MARPKKPRFDKKTGLELPDNLYPDGHGREGYWRYFRPNGSHKTFMADTTNAIEFAKEANKLRDNNFAIPKSMPARSSFAYWIEKYIDWRIGYDPDLEHKDSWRNRCGHLRKFAGDFCATPVNKVQIGPLREWWENLSYHQQHSRRAEFNKLFNFLASHSVTPLLPFNPFTTSDDRPRLMEKRKPESKRMRLPIDAFWQIYDAAGIAGYPGLQIAMGISLVTTMRREDIAQLKFEKHVTADALRKTINKSEAQRRSTSAAHLSFRFDRHPLLSKLVQQARELSMLNARCPYLITNQP